MSKLDKQSVTPLPSREELATSDREVWAHALSVASQNIDLDLTTAGILDHLRHLIVIGRLVDREAIDYDEMRSFADDLGFPGTKRFLRDLFAIGIGDTPND